MKNKPKYICIESNCDKKVWHRNTRCRKHAEIYKIYPSREGKNNSQFKDGRTLEKYYCVGLNCNKEISKKSAIYSSKMCRSCSCKERYKDQKNHPMFGKKRPDMSARTGSNNFNWNNNSSYERYPLAWNKTFKERIRYRDGYKCQNSECGILEIECKRKLHVHHIDYDKQNINPENLISLCHSCREKTNGHRDYWYAYFTYIMEEYKISNQM